MIAEVIWRQAKIVDDHLTWSSVVSCLSGSLSIVDFYSAQLYSLYCVVYTRPVISAHFGSLLTCVICRSTSVSISSCWRRIRVKRRNEVDSSNHSLKVCLSYNTIRDAILTCTRKPTWVRLIYHTEAWSTAVTHMTAMEAVMLSSSSFHFPDQTSYIYFIYLFRNSRMRTYICSQKAETWMTVSQP